MASATFEDVIIQLQKNNRSEAGRDGRHTMGLKMIAAAIMDQGRIIEQTSGDDDGKGGSKGGKQSSAIIKGFKSVAKDLKLTDVANNITSPITGFFKSLPTLIPGGTKAVAAAKFVGKKAVNALQVEKEREKANRDKKQLSITEKLYHATVNGFGSLLKGFGKAAGLGLGVLLSPLFLIAGIFRGLLDEFKGLARLLSGFRWFQGAKEIGLAIIKVVKGFFMLMVKTFQIGGTKIASIVKSFFSSGVPKALKLFVTDFINSYVDMFKRAVGFGLKIVGKIKSLGESIKKFLSVTKGVTDVKGLELNKFQKAIVNIKKFGSLIAKGGKLLATVLGQLFRPFKYMFDLVMSVFKPVISGLKAGVGTIAKFAGAFGRILGRIFLPVTIIMGVFDSISGFIEGFKESEGESLLARVIDGLGSGLGKLFGNLVGVPLDLLKNVVAWVLGKMGFENAEETLKNFSIKDKIKEMFEGLFGLFSKGIDYIINLFTGDGSDTGPIGFIKRIFKGVGNLYLDFYRLILRTILPVPKASDGKIFGFIKRAISEAVPDAVYKFAGINKETGERLEKPDDSALGMTTEEIERQSLDGGGNGRNGDVYVTTNDNSQNINNGTYNDASGDGYLDNEFQAGVAYNGR